MNFAVTLLMMAQAASTSAPAEAPARSEPIAISATASVEILPPTIIRFGSNQVEQVDGAAPPQRNTTSAGQTWIEFS